MYSDTGHFKAALQNYAGVCAPGDQLFVYLGVHGDTGRQSGDMSRTPCETHGMQATSGYFHLSDIAPSFRAIGRRGCDLIVIDGSCEGGETVYDAFGQRYSAMSTTGANEVALTNNPDPGSETSTESKPAVFGTWWTPPHVVGSRLNGLILLEMAHSGRIQQRLYRNDNTATTQVMLFARPALDHLNILTDWWLDARGCYLYKLLWPASAAAKVAQDPKRTWTNTAQSMLDATANVTTPEKPSLAAYQTSVLDPAYDSALADMYAANSDVIWQCMANDAGWDIAHDPSKHAADMGNVQPSSFSGAAGFETLLNTAYASFLTMQACYDKSFALIGALDAAVRSSPTLSGQAPPLSQAPLLSTTHVGLALNSDDPAVNDFMTQRTNALRAMQERVMSNTSAISSQSAPTTKPVSADVRAQLDQRVSLWKASALTEPTEDATFDDLAAQLMGTYAEYASNAFSGSFLLSVVEDLVCAHQSSGKPVPGDLVTF